MKEYAKEYFVITQRKKNKQTIQKLGLSLESVRRILFELRVENYSQGPSRDESGKHNDVWVFGYRYEQIDLYIKVSVCSFPNGETGVVCVSFHEAERELRFPHGGHDGHN
jgi:hypothetical protein